MDSKDNVTTVYDSQKAPANKNKDLIMTRKNFKDEDEDEDGEYLYHPTSVLQCFGLNSDGQTLVPQSLMTRVVLVSSGGFHSCLIKNEQ